jgi:hypothetical protein
LNLANSLAGAQSAKIRFHHFRDKDGCDVDLVLERFAAGVVLYDGETGIRFEDRMFEIPISTLWEPGS